MYTKPYSEKIINEGLDTPLETKDNTYTNSKKGILTGAQQWTRNENESPPS